MDAEFQVCGLKILRRSFHGHISTLKIIDLHTLKKLKVKILGFFFFFFKQKKKKKKKKVLHVMLMTTDTEEPWHFG